MYALSKCLLVAVCVEFPQEASSDEEATVLGGKRSKFIDILYELDMNLCYCLARSEGHTKI